MRGSYAKQAVAEKLATAFGKDYIGEYDKKYFVWANDNGERVQIAISLTCPKNQIQIENAIIEEGDFDFTDKSKTTSVPVTKAEPAEITEEEKKNIAILMEKLGL